MIILYGENETSFTSMGLGPIPDAVSCNVAEDTECSFELEMEYPVNGVMASELTMNRIIYALPTPLSGIETYLTKAQPFRIYGIDDAIGGTFTIHAHHISYDMSGIVVSPYTEEGDATTGALDAGINGLEDHIRPVSMKNKFSITTLYHPTTTTADDTTTTSEDNKTKKFEMSTPLSLRATLVDTILKEFEYCVWKFNKFSATLYSDGRDASRSSDAKRGSNKGVVLRYGKHFTDLTQERNNALVVSGIYPYWGSSSSSSKSVSSILLTDLQAYVSGSTMSINQMVTDTGLTREQVLAFANEYKNSNPHTVDLSSIGGKTTGGESTQTAEDTTHKGDGTTVLFTLAYSFTAVDKVTIAGKTTKDYTVDLTNRTITFTTAPAADSAIVIKGTVPGIVTLPDNGTTVVGGVYTPSDYTPPTNSYVIPVDLSSEFSNLPTVDDLLQKAAEYWKDNNIGEPTVSITVEYNDPRKISDFMNIPDLDSIELCDTVTVVFEEKNIQREVQVNKIEYDCINDRIVAIELGEPKKTLAKTIVEATAEESKQTTINETVANTPETLTSSYVVYMRTNDKVNVPTEGDWTEEKPAATTSTPYLWQKTVSVYSTGRTDEVCVCIDDGSKSAETTEETQTVYHLSNAESVNPPVGSDGKPVWVTSTSLSTDVWTTKVPSPAPTVEEQSPYVYYYLVQTKAVDGTVSNGPIETQAMSDVLYGLLYVDSNSAVTIEGSRLKAGSVVAASIATKTLTADKISANGLLSTNYLAPASGSHFARSGLKINFEAGDVSIIGEHFALASDGKAYFDGEIAATGGTIGALKIASTGFDAGGTSGATFKVLVTGTDTIPEIDFYVGRIGSGAFIKYNSTDSLIVSGADVRGVTLSSDTVISESDNNYTLTTRLVPVVDLSTDKDKYLHTNASTGDLEWVSGSGGGSMPTPTAANKVLMSTGTDTLTWTETDPASLPGILPLTAGYTVPITGELHIQKSGKYSYVTQMSVIQDGYYAFRLSTVNNSGTGGFKIETNSDSVIEFSTTLKRMIIGKDGGYGNNSGFYCNFDRLRLGSSNYAPTVYPYTDATGSLGISNRAWDTSYINNINVYLPNLTTPTDTSTDSRQDLRTWARNIQKKLTNDASITLSAAGGIGVTNPLIAHDANHVGKFLSVIDDGQGNAVLSWETVSSGTTYAEGDGIQIDTTQTTPTINVWYGNGLKIDTSDSDKLAVDIVSDNGLKFSNSDVLDIDYTYVQHALTAGPGITLYTEDNQYKIKTASDVLTEQYYTTGIVLLCRNDTDRSNSTLALYVNNENYNFISFSGMNSAGTTYVYFGALGLDASGNLITWDVTRGLLYYQTAINDNNKLSSYYVECELGLVTTNVHDAIYTLNAGLSNKITAPSTTGIATTKYLVWNGSAWALADGSGGGTTYAEGDGIQIDTTQTTPTINVWYGNGLKIDTSDSDKLAVDIVSDNGLKFSNSDVLDIDYTYVQHVVDSTHRLDAEYVDCNITTTVTCSVQDAIVAIRQLAQSKISTPSSLTTDYYLKYNGTTWVMDSPGGVVYTWDDMFTIDTAHNNKVSLNYDGNTITNDMGNMTILLASNGGLAPTYLSSNPGIKVSIGRGLEMSGNDIQTIFPECPNSTDGDFVLCCTIDNGTRSYHWTSGY